MTEKINNGNGSTPKWFWPLYLASLPILMTLVIMMVGYYLNRLTDEVDENKKEIRVIKNHVRDMSRIQYNDADTSPDERDELRPIFHETRGSIE